MKHERSVFDALILIARPAAGKSEVIDFLKQTPLKERQQRFHIGAFTEFDDFPFIWQMFEEDELLTKLGQPRVWTTPDCYFKDHYIWNFLIEKLNLAVQRRQQENPQLMQGETAIIEFSRGGDQAFAEAFHHLDSEILKHAAVLYINVSYAESVRKNRRRARTGKEHSILYHSLPDDKMEHYYKSNDWQQLSSHSPTHLDLKGVQVPYVVLENEPEVTDDPQLLGPALEQVLGRLWSLRKTS